LIAWRGTLDATPIAARIYLAPGPTLDGTERASGRLPDSGARQINVVAVVPGTWNRPGLERPRRDQEIRLRSPHRVGPDRADDDQRHLYWRKWALFTVPDGGQCTDGAIALLGDAGARDAAVCAKAREGRSRMRRYWQSASAEAAGESAANIRRP